LTRRRRDQGRAKNRPPLQCGHAAENWAIAFRSANRRADSEVCHLRYEGAPSSDRVIHLPASNRARDRCSDCQRSGHLVTVARSCTPTARRAWCSGASHFCSEPWALAGCRPHWGSSKQPGRGGTNPLPGTPAYFRTSPGTTVVNSTVIFFLTGIVLLVIGFLIR
jgi:hypothetical protein